MPACTPRMLSVLRDLARHPGGLLTPELAARRDSAARSKDGVRNSYGATMRIMERRGLVRRAGVVRGKRRHGPAVIWQATAEGRGVAADPGPAGAPAQAAYVVRHDIFLGSAGSVSVTVSILRPGAVPAEKLARIRQLIGELELMASAVAR